MADKFIESGFDVLQVFIKVQMVGFDVGDGDNFGPIV